MSERTHLDEIVEEECFGPIGSRPGEMIAHIAERVAHRAFAHGVSQSQFGQYRYPVNPAPAKPKINTGLCECKCHPGCQYCKTYVDEIAGLRKERS